MSFKIFSLQLTGKIKPVAKIEQQRESLLNDYREFLEVEKSDELKELLELEAFVQSSEFKKRKKEIGELQFKGSNEQKELSEFEKLKKSKRIKNYFKIDGSNELKRFGQVKESDKLKEYQQLSEYIKGGTFQREKKEKTDEAKSKQRKFKSLKTDSDIRFCLKFEKSSLYKNYLDVKVSSDLKRYNELKEKTTSKEFLDRKVYLEDKNKWEKTEEYQKEKRYSEMKKMPHIVKYFKYKGGNAFDFFKTWDVVFEDDFSASLDTEKWSTINHHAEKVLGENYSLPGDLHVFTSGNNVKTGGKLTVEVKKETTKGKMWKMPAGFIPAEFEYTSGFVSTFNSFQQQDGLFEVKFRFNPLKQIVSTITLQGEKNEKMITLLEMGTKNRIGVSTLSGSGKMDVNGIDISNLKSGKSYIFSVEKVGKTIIWKINETEVFKIDTNDISYPLHLNISSIVVHDIPGHSLPARFEVDWVKCYSKK